MPTNVSTASQDLAARRLALVQVWRWLVTGEEPGAPTAAPGADGTVVHSADGSSPPALPVSPATPVPAEHWHHQQLPQQQHLHDQGSATPKWE